MMIQARERQFAGTGREKPRLGLCTLFSNIFENIEGPAHFHIREYEKQMPRPAFPSRIRAFRSP